MDLAHTLTLEVLPGTFAICRLAPNSAVPEWAVGTDFASITRTPSELSIVCAQERVPPGVSSAGGWRGLRVAGALDFALTGILAALAAPLAAAGVSIFAVSTYDTDYLLVPERQIAEAIAALERSGHKIADAPGADEQ